MFCWPKLYRDVVRYVQWCRKFHNAKSHSQIIGFYTPFPKPTAPWEEVSMDFASGLPKTKYGHDSILVVVAFQKWLILYPTVRL